MFHPVATTAGPHGLGPQRSVAYQKAVSAYACRQQSLPGSFLSVNDLNDQELRGVLNEALNMKDRPQDFTDVLLGASVALLFQKTSTRTRCSFENAVVEMGGHASYIDWRTSNFILSDLRDEIAVLSRYYDLIVARVNEHATLETMAQHSEAPVINGLCDRMHPCQALGDYMTMMEYFGPDLTGLRIAFIGDGNNVCRSLVHGAVKLGAHVNLCAPPSYGLDPQTLKDAKGMAFTFSDPIDAVWDADVVYTDTWVSMGDESETQERLAAFAPYQVNASLMAHAPDHALFMHCLPAHPGQEVSAEVLRGPRSIVLDQAENRKHAQKALLKLLSR